jgi:hypothetical protein
VEADFSIECGADDECLEIPWASEDGALRYVDLKQNPALIADLEEAQRFPELAEFLRIANSRLSPFQSAKCDAWFTHEMTADEVFGASGKFGSYVDFLFASSLLRSSLEQHEVMAASLVRLLQSTPEMQASAEFLVRRCYFPSEAGMEEGFYFTSYVFGYSETEDRAREHWRIALRLVGNALVEISGS